MKKLTFREVRQHGKVRHLVTNSRGRIETINANNSPAPVTRNRVLDVVIVYKLPGEIFPFEGNGFSINGAHRIWSIIMKYEDISCT